VSDVFQNSSGDVAANLAYVRLTTGAGIPVHLCIKINILIAVCIKIH
jgi:hypothetical protein